LESHSVDDLSWEAVAESVRGAVLASRYPSFQCVLCLQMRVSVTASSCKVRWFSHVAPGVKPAEHPWTDEETAALQVAAAAHKVFRSTPYLTAVFTRSWPCVRAR
jgi:hypothetical protein